MNYFMVGINWESRVWVSAFPLLRVMGRVQKESLGLYLRSKRKGADWVFVGRFLCLMEVLAEIFSPSCLVNLG